MFPYKVIQKIRIKTKLFYRFKPFLDDLSKKTDVMILKI